MRNDKLPKFNYEIGETLKDDKRDLIIIDREYRKENRGESNVNAKYYKYKCNKCNFACGEHYAKGEYRKGLWIDEYNLKKGTGCACCYNRVTVFGINTIWDTNRWMCDLGLSEEDAKRNTYGTPKKVEVICPDCNNKKMISINKIYSRKTISCICNDNKSYPEKFMTDVLNQLNAAFIKEVAKTTFDWCNDCRYDFYVPSLNMIIEIHGEQHYRHTGRGRSLVEEQENDRVKKELALANGIDRYVVIDCRKSEFDWMTFNIFKSLKDYFDMTVVNFANAELFALSNLTKRICDRWNNKKEWEDTSTLAKEFFIDRSTVLKHIKKGIKYGWCEYDGKEEMRKNAYKKTQAKKKPVEVFKDGISLGVFESATDIEELSEQRFGTKLLQNEISKVCNGKKSKYKGYDFIYI